jgi:hypothetical protein
MKNVQNKLVSFLNNYSTVNINNCSITSIAPPVGQVASPGIIGNFSSITNINNSSAQKDNRASIINIINEYNSQLYVNNSNIYNINYFNSRYKIEHNNTLNKNISCIVYQTNGNILLNSNNYKSLINNVELEKSTIELYNNVSDLNWYVLTANELSNIRLDYKFNRNYRY